LDEEGVNLLKYQKAYTASARFMTTLDEALDMLINRTGVVGR
jgi:flagellar hook-associated protein 1 FlgK